MRVAAVFGAGQHLSNNRGPFQSFCLLIRVMERNDLMLRKQCLLCSRGGL